MQTILAMVLCWLAWQPAGREMREVTLAGGGVMRYAAVLPEGHKPETPVPVLVALAPGGASRELIDLALTRYWEGTAKARGWAVLSPAPPEGKSLVESTASLGEFLDAIPTIVTPAGKVHLAGVSNGGRAAVRLAILRPEAFGTIVLAPGVPAEASDWAKIEAIVPVPVMAFVGETDEGAWVEGSHELQRRLGAAGGSCVLEVLPGQGHVLDLKPEAIFDWMETYRSGRAITPEQRGEARLKVEAALNDFHDAASKADKTRYLGHFAPGGVFLGTDASERWSVEEFRVFVAGYFDQGKGWTYTPRQRWVTIADDGMTAWFDEMLDNAKLGTCRGSGTLVLQAGRWRIAQYNLSVPVPNTLMGEVVELIRRKGEGK